MRRSNAEFALIDQALVNSTLGMQTQLKALQTRFNLQKVSDSITDLPTREELSDFLKFQKYFFKLRTGIEFRISKPKGRISHHYQLATMAPKIFNHEINRLMINIAPRYGKTEWAIAMMAYGWAYFPKSKWMYISIDPKLVKKACKYVKQIVCLPEFRQIYNIEVTTTNSDPSSITILNNQGGELYGVSSGGGIAGNGAGLQAVDSFGGAILIDDFHKISEIHSELTRDKAAETYEESILNRRNNPAFTPIIFIGQICHEDDLPTRLKKGKHDVERWNQDEGGKGITIELQSLDRQGNALYPEMHTTAMLLEMQDKVPYMFAAQHQQKASPAGGAVFKIDRLVLYDRDDIYQQIFFTFITIDSAETDKNYSDPTAMVFFGVYKIQENGKDTGELGLHIIDAIEERILPDKLEERFNDFYAKCCMFPVKPKLVGIEKESTGVTLLAILGKKQGLEVVDTIPFRRASNDDPIVEQARKQSGKSSRMSKTVRFLACVWFVSSRFVSLTEGMKYTRMVTEHLESITANDTHKHDDIADCVADAIYMMYITKYIPTCIERLAAANAPKAIQNAIPARTGAIGW